MCAHGVHFEDPVNTTRTIVGNGDTVVSTWPKRSGKVVNATEYLQGHNVRIGRNMLLTIDGGYPFRLCGWVPPRKYISFLYGAKTAKLQTVPVTVPEKCLYIGGHCSIAKINGADITDSVLEAKQNRKSAHNTAPGNKSAHNAVADDVDKGADGIEQLAGIAVQEGNEITEVSCEHKRTVEEGGTTDTETMFNRVPVPDENILVTQEPSNNPPQQGRRLRPRTRGRTARK